MTMCLIIFLFVHASLMFLLRTLAENMVFFFFFFERERERERERMYLSGAFLVLSRHLHLGQRKAKPSRRSLDLF